MSTYEVRYKITSEFVAPVHGAASEEEAREAFRILGALGEVEILDVKGASDE